MKLAATSRLPLGLLLLGRAEEHSQAVRRRPAASASGTLLEAASVGTPEDPTVPEKPGRQPPDLLWGPAGWSSYWKSCGEQGS